MYSGNKPRLRVIGWGNVVLGWALPLRMLLEFVREDHYAAELSSFLVTVGMTALLSPFTVLSGRAVLLGRKSVLSWTFISTGLWVGSSVLGVAGWALTALNRGLSNVLSGHEWSIGPWEIPVFMDVLLFLWWQYCKIVVWSEAQTAVPPSQLPSKVRLMGLLTLGAAVGALARIGQVCCDFHTYHRIIR